MGRDIVEGLELVRVRIQRAQHICSHWWEEESRLAEPVSRAQEKLTTKQW
jgi:hypothetical protein